MRALGFEPKKEEIKKMISDIDKEGSGKQNKYKQRMIRGTDRDAITHNAISVAGVILCKEMLYRSSLM